MPNRKISLLILFFVLLLAGCNSQSPTDASGQTVEVEASAFQFSPDHVTVSAGGSVKVTSMDVDHNFTIDALNISVPIPAKQTVVVSLAGKSVGTYTFYCAVDSHREQGMVGTLVITQSSSQSNGYGY